jgi:hypothetical protein
VCCACKALPPAKLGTADTRLEFASSHLEAFHCVEICCDFSFSVPHN